MSSRQETAKLKGRGTLRSSYESIQTTPKKQRKSSSFYNSVPSYSFDKDFPAVSRFFPILQYKEQQYLNHVLIVATSTKWEFIVEEDEEAQIEYIQVAVSGNLDSNSSMSSNSVKINITNCKTYEEFQQFQQQIQTPEGIIPSWTAFRIFPTRKDQKNDNTKTVCYVVILKKPTQNGSSDLTPVRFYFRGTYEGNNNIAWQQESSNSILLSNDTNKWKEIAFTILTLAKMGYKPTSLNKPVSFFFNLYKITNRLHFFLIRYIFFFFFIGYKNSMETFLISY